MTINLSVIGAVEPSGPGVGAHIQSNHPLNHLLHPATAPGPYGIQLDVTFQGIAQAPGPLAGLGQSISNIAPSFLHLGFDQHDLDPSGGTFIGPLGIDIQGTGIDFPSLGLPIPTLPLALDSTIVKLLNNLGDK